MDNVIDENFEILCHVWLKQIHLSNPSEIIVLYNKNPPHFLKDYPSVKLIYCDYDPNFKKPLSKYEERNKTIHFLIGFKLYNLLKIEPPFIFLDADAIPTGDIRQLWNLRNEKPFIGCGHQNITSLISFFEHHGFGRNTRDFLNSGVLLINDTSFINVERIKHIYKEFVKDEENYFIVADDTLLNIYFKEIGYNFHHEKIDNGWNASPTTIFKIKENINDLEIIAKDDSGIFQKIKILHFYGPQSKPWIKKCSYYNYLLKLYNFEREIKPLKHRDTIYRKNFEDKIINYYKRFDDFSPDIFKVDKDFVISSFSMGLGDSMILTDILNVSEGKLKVYSTSKHFYHLVKNYPYLKFPRNEYKMYNIHEIIRFENCGVAGHYLQRLRNLYNYEVDSKPKSYLPSLSKDFQIKKRIAIHIEPSEMNDYQMTFFSPLGGNIKPENLKVIQNFIKKNCSTYEFYSIGKETFFDNCQSVYFDTAEYLYLFLNTCDYFIGIDSGPMHVAAALNIKSIIILSHVPYETIVLPNLKNPHVDHIGWLYPQNIHLHQEGENDFVKYFSTNNLDKAFDGEIYPFFSDRYLDLIQEYIIKP